MKVLFVSPAAELGGAERCLLDCVAALTERAELQVEVLFLAHGPLVEKARELGAQTRVVRTPPSLARLGESGSRSESGLAILRLMMALSEVARFVSQLRRALTIARPDVVHSNGMKAHLFAGALAPSQSRLVVHLHDFISSRRASKSILPMLQTARRDAVFVANSQAVARDFTSIAPTADVRTIYNVVDTDYFRDGPAEPEWLSSLAGLEAPTTNTTSFALVATYARWKGHGLFIKAAGLLKKARPDIPVRFYIVGGPIYDTLGSQVRASELLQQARSANIQRDFGLVSFQEDIARVYRSIDVMVHASTEPEPFGRTIIEAMACARPVLVARAGGAIELFQEGVNALGFEPRNVAQLADAMAHVLDEAALRARLGQAARQHVVAGFGRSRLTAELLDTYTR